MEGINLIHGDSLQALKGYSDNHFDWAIVDPPYGISLTKSPRLNKDKGWSDGGWDDSIPTAKYFNEIIRVSKNQIIWGWNYFTDYLPPCRGVICWDKMNHTENFSDVEIAYCSIDSVAKKFTYMWDGNRYGFPSKIQGVGKKSIRIHPAQKPIDLYRWILKNYTSEGDLILDTHLGSGSIALACHYMKRNLIGYEIDKEYYDAACKRFKEQTMQQALW